MRRILDSGRGRWTPLVVVIAFLCSSVGELDRRAVHIDGIPLPLMIAAGALFGALIWLLLVYLLAWVVTVLGRLFEATGTVRETAAAIAYGLVPIIWTVILRLPAAMYIRSLNLNATSGREMIMEFVHRGGCLIAVLAFGLKLFIDAWVVVVMSNTVGEALRFSSLRGFAVLAISAGLPLMIMAAALLAVRMS